MNSKKIFFGLALLICALSFSQSINYKAIIKDDIGNVLANTDVDVRFFISNTNFLLYTEVHNTQTDNNGLVILNIGEGTPIFGSFNLNWSSFTYSLNVQIDLGDGFVDMGTTPFNSVPYANRAFRADEADNVNGLIIKTEGNGSGWRLRYRGVNSTEGYGPIGLNAIDLSSSNANGAALAYPYGATGDYSFAAGQNTVAYGDYSVAMGRSNQSVGDYSFSVGNLCRAFEQSSIALGQNNISWEVRSIAIGSENESRSRESITIGTELESNVARQIVLGRFNEPWPTDLLNSWGATVPLLTIGNGSTNENRGNALVILGNGNTGIGADDPQERLHIANGRLRIGNETIEDGGSDVLAFSSSLVPTVDEEDRLGGPNRKWLDVWAMDGTINTSDRREKKNISALEYGLAEILQMQPVSFNWKSKNSPDTKLGLIAQDVQTLIPEVVKTHIWEKHEVTGALTKKQLDRLGVYYSDLIPVLIKAIQEQQKIIESEKSINAKQSDQLETLLSRIEQLESKSSN